MPMLIVIAPATTMYVPVIVDKSINDFLFVSTKKIIIELTRKPSPHKFLLW